MQKRLVVALGIAVMGLSLSAAAQNFEFKGIRLGMPVSELKSTYPNLFCDEQGPNVQTCTEERGEGDAQESFVLNIYDGKVARANIWLSGAKYKESRDTLVRQFGKPTNRSEAESNKKKSEVLTWMKRAPSALLVVEQTAAKDPAKMSVMMNDDMLIAAMSKAK